MPLRVRLTGIKPFNFMRTFHKDTVINVSELGHLLPAAHVKELFPPGAGIHLDFSDRRHIALRSEENAIVQLNNTPMQFGETYTLLSGDLRTLTIGRAELRLHVTESFF